MVPASNPNGCGGTRGWFPPALKYFLFCILFLPSFHAISAVAYGTCIQYPGGQTLGNEYTRAQCKAETLETFKIGRPSVVGSYETGGPTNYDYYAVTSTGGTIGQTGTFHKIGTMECPAGTVQNSAGTGCDPDPQAVCQAKAGQTTSVSFQRLGQAGDVPHHDVGGCLVELTGVSVCLPRVAGDFDGVIDCYGDGKFTGQPATGGSPGATADPPPSELPPNPIIVSDSIPVVDGVPQIPPGEVTTTEGGITYGWHMEGDVLVVDTIQDNNRTVTRTEETIPRAGGGTITNTEAVVQESGGYERTETYAPKSGGGVVYNVTNNNYPSTEEKGSGQEVEYPDGSKSGTCEGPACPENPDKPKGNEYANASCDAMPTCRGDPIQCAQAIQAWRTMCQIKKDNERIFGTEEEDQAARQAIESELIESPADLEERLGVTYVDFSDYLDFSETLFPVAAACPADQTVSVMGHTVAVSMGPLCTFADVIRPIVILCAYIMGAIILFRAIAQKY